MIAALYVEPDGVYSGLPDVELWDEARDARKYAGPWPVVAHPPCQRWGNRWWWLGRSKPRGELGDDGGCFSAALESVRAFGGVLEHPSGSRAWWTFGLPEPPRSGGWVRGICGGWTCHVEQGAYGHVAPKATWLYAVRCEPPSLHWGHSGATGRVDFMPSGRARAATPIAFRDVLLSMARSVRQEAA